MINGRLATLNKSGIVIFQNPRILNWIIQINSCAGKLHCHKPKYTNFVLRPEQKPKEQEQF